MTEAFVCDDERDVELINGHVLKDVGSRNGTFVKYLILQNYI
jgi:hypothetical protein